MVKEFLHQPHAYVWHVSEEANPRMAIKHFYDAAEIPNLKALKKQAMYMLGTFMLVLLIKVTVVKSLNL